MGDVKMRRENIRYEARGKSFEIECPSGFSGIEAIVCWCDAGIQPVEVGLAAGEWVMYQLQKGRE